MKFRILFLAGLLALGVVLATVLYMRQVQPPVEPTLTSAFQIFGETVRVVDRLAARAMPVDDFDEAALGEAYKSYYEQVKDRPGEIYVNDVLAAVTVHTAKDFSYVAMVDPSPAPNAMALPGGVVFVTQGLLDTLDNEAQLAAVLAHEVGHIELSHCVDAIKYEITARKLGVMQLGQVADFAVDFFVRYSFSKTQEHEADLYAWTMLRNSRYDPRGVGGAFVSMMRWTVEQGMSGYDHGPFRDYFASHPPLEVRAHEFGNRADKWWRKNASERRYAGAQNLEDLTALSDGEGFPLEWVTGS
jgi:predicted Zn-dependent protease